MTNDEGLLRTLLASTRETVLVTDGEGRIVLVSNGFAETTGLPAEDLAGAPIERLGRVDGLPAAADLVRGALQDGASRIGPVALPGLAGPWELAASPVARDGRAQACLAVLRTAESGSARREGFDALTGLPNRHLFGDRVEQALHNARRSGKSVAVMLIGIDRFSDINDVLGRQDGDRVLVGVTERLRQCVRTSDTVARLESDRFAFVMQISAIDDSVLLTEKVLRAFEQPVSLGEQRDVAVTGSVGVSIFPADGETTDELIRNAAVALHHAQQGGRHRSQFFSGEMNARARHRLEVESGIRRGLANREFLVYYQPKVDVNSRRVAGMEALVRWRDPQRGLVAPGEFIPVAEESGLIEQIGQWVLEETCAQNRRWQDEGLPPVRASVNVSARQFRNRNFVAIVEEVLARTGLAPRWLELEITESMLMGDIGAIVARMEDLRRVGVSLSIDDFGTGYSSLSYLSRFPITTLKIDRAFITDVQSNPHTAEIARAIIGLSRGLNLEVVAEGAEVKEQVEFLQAHGCELVQGFYYSRPLPAEEFAAMLRDGPRPA
ncbi:MAG: EAL domain-containing protein [Sterolibacteriaceae bacterium MAG5]|nr:EAL domain-containing protein [Candidatus Nitricoxidireducens bremensis]